MDRSKIGWRPPPAGIWKGFRLGVDGRLFAPGLHPAPSVTGQDPGQSEIWRSNLRKAVLDSVDGFVADWHRDRGLSGCAERIGESAAVLFGDLCPVWTEQMLRDSGLDRRALCRAWPRYDGIRTELAVGQFADLVNDVGGPPTLDEVLEVARRKSGSVVFAALLDVASACAQRAA